MWLESNLHHFFTEKWLEERVKMNMSVPASHLPTQMCTMDHLLQLAGGFVELRWKQREGGREGKGKLELRGNGHQIWGTLVELLLSQVGFTQPSGA